MMRDRTSSEVNVVAGGDDDLLTARHVRLSGRDEEIGYDLAAAAYEAHGARVRPAPIDPEVERARRRWFERNDPHMAGRLSGFARFFGVSPTDCSVSCDSVPTYGRRASCTVGFYPPAITADGHALLSRNMDFPTKTASEYLGRPRMDSELAMVADTWIVEMHPDGGRSSVTIGFGDAFGAQDGINDAGLVVALLAASVDPPLEPTYGPEVGLSESQVVQYVLSNCASAGEARDALRLAKHYYLAMPCHYVVADRSGDVFVWEHSRHHNRELVVTPPRGSGGRMVCTNHLLHLEPDATGLPDDHSPVATATRTHHRWSTLTSLIAAAGLVDVGAAHDQLAAVRFDETSAETHTIWHAIYDLQDCSLDVSFLLDATEPEHRYSPRVSLSVGAGTGRPT